MQRISREEFLAKAAAGGVGLDTRYAPPQSLVFMLEPGVWARWARPTEPSRTLCLLTRMLEAVGSWRVCWLYKRAGSWHHRGSEQSDLQDTVLALQLAWLDVPPQFDGALEATDQDAAHIVAVCHSYLGLGRSVWDDIAVVPEGADAILETSHHGEIVVTARSTERLEVLSSRLRAQGFAPDE